MEKWKLNDFSILYINYNRMEGGGEYERLKVKSGRTSKKEPAAAAGSPGIYSGKRGRSS